jgi:hypothetical protein
MLGLPAPYRTSRQYALYSNRSYTLPGGSWPAASLSIFHNPPLFTKADYIHYNKAGILVEA